jgi:kynurenine formamidase
MLSSVFNTACQVIDLSHAYSAAAPHYPGDRPIERRQAGGRATDGFLDYRLDMAEHCGTHLDAPLHFAEGGLAVDEIPLAKLMGPLVVIDISARARHDPDAQVEVSDITGWTSRHGALAPGAILAMRSGWSSRWHDTARYFGSINGQHHSPGWSLAAVTYLIEKSDAVGIGVDTASIDPFVASDFPVHRAWLGAGRWALENLNGLDQVPEQGGWLVAAVARIAGATGFPARVFAGVPNQNKQ